MLTRLAVLLAGLALASAGLESDWKTYKQTYGKSYKGEEDAFRRNIWQKNMEKISTHNILYYKGESSYLKGENKFTDLTPEEMKKYTGLNMFVPEGAKSFTSGKYKGVLPDEVNWVKKGWVTEIKDQEQCGSCWAFSITGAIEGQHFNATGKLVSLSESNLVDCCTSKQGCHGCDGGCPYSAMQYVIDNKGIDTEKSYPYVDKERKCAFKKSDIGATISSYLNITEGSEDALQLATADVGPISVGIDASGMYYYKSGVFDFPMCSTTLLDHAVLVVGYGVEDGKDYWLVKNSWGVAWGEKGYIKMSRNKKNQCGIASAALYPVV